MLNKKTGEITMCYMSCYDCEKKFKIGDIVCMSENCETITCCKTLEEAKKHNFDTEIGVVTKIIDMKKHPKTLYPITVKWWNGQSSRHPYYSLEHLKCRRENSYDDYVNCDVNKFF